MSIREAIRHYRETAVRLACQVGKDSLKFEYVANGCWDRLDANAGCSGFEGVQPVFPVCCCYWIVQHRHPRNPRRNLFEQLQPFAPQRALSYYETGCIAARTRKARDKTATDRIGNHRENDWDRARLL